MGGRFYPALLSYLQELCAIQTMLDKLNCLEQLGLLDRVSDWNILRSVINQFTHGYPQDAGLKAAYLNEVVPMVKIFKQILYKSEAFILKHHLLK